MDTAGVCNLTLQRIGTRTTVTLAELNANSTNEAIQFNLAYAQVRDELLRLAPWQCCKAMTDLQYVTSLIGTPENQSQPTEPPFPQNPVNIAPTPNQWQPGLPLPNWTYEYEYPVDCLRALRIIAGFNPAVTGTPIYPTSTAVGYYSTWQGAPITFDVGQDLFYPVTAATVVSGGTNYAVGDIIGLALGPITSMPVGIPAQLQVASAPGGVISAVTVVPSIYGEDTPQTGGYFAKLSNPQAQGTTTGSGTGATFNLTYGPQGQQRVILTNQEYAVLNYCRRVTDWNVMDSQFLRAFYNVMGAQLCMALTGNIDQANKLVGYANAMIQEARSTDGNEALSINDVTPDWLRVRGVIYSDYWSGGTGYGWDQFGLWPSF